MTCPLLRYSHSVPLNFETTYARDFFTKLLQLTMCSQKEKNHGYDRNLSCYNNLDYVPLRLSLGAPNDRTSAQRMSK